MWGTSKVVTNLLRSCNLRLVTKRNLHAGGLKNLIQISSLDGLFSKEGLDNAWFNRSKMYVNQLNAHLNNQQTSSSAADMLSSLNISNLESFILKYSKSSDKTDLVILASLLYNLQFSLSSLRPSLTSVALLKEKPKTLYNNDVISVLSSNSNNPSTIQGTEALSQALIGSFGSIEEFKTNFINSALSISGDGYTWLVARHKKNNFSSSSSSLVSDGLFVVNTYNAGTPFNIGKVGHLNEITSKLSNNKNMENKSQQDNLDMMVDSTSSSISYQKSVTEAQNYDRFDHNIHYIPILAIDSSPKAYLTDYGSFGKILYLNNIWNSIDWNVAQSRLPKIELAYLS
ncbi:hypothetical protein TBLA_0H01710 [Henningerozyma blattae CBS 6284]|uniref:Manganese/iron superoxide dismutase C-terminal domain-containing protein n=1 Tax=Henningerozyma blattae (strain ATCC 34711 / CBS 6284 / DSM 70876 / NBRC 10599 / NRRL Y-10934 / UCD 77-7) TaxID=1071380 RepID=I2H7V6_HENB6|nr:hypothetical protein TBLA_0H01710 [Tetrapisispora blattae CBS 6284]CCH62458.1 hypothetical protein TBLA_0H01710 [Tetrapisispora blattae CBS 6284]